MNAVDDAQAWAITNEGDDRSVVLHELYDQALNFIQTGEGDRRLGLFVWSGRPGCDLLDTDETAQANPNLGRRIQWDSLEGKARRAVAAGGEVEAKYRTEVLCQRVRRLKTQPIPADAWAQTSQDVRPSGDPVFFVTVAKEMTSATIAVAAVHNGVPHVELAEYKPGVAWLTPRVQELRARYPNARFGAYQAGPVKSWVPTLAEFGVTLELMSAVDASAACAHLQRLSDDLAFTHSPDPVLAESLRGAERRDLDGGGWAWDWHRSSGDLAPLAGVTGALWMLESNRPAEPAFAFS